MRKQLLLKMLLMTVGLFVGTSVWAATPTLKNTLEVAGYKAKAYYDFTTNTPEVLATSGDLRFRSGYGFHNYGSGKRSGTATIPVAETDIVIIEGYNSNDTFAGGNITINRGTKNTTLTSTVNVATYEVFEISTTADDITFSNNRYYGIRAAFVMEVDNTVSTVDYTVNYKVNGVGENIKTTEGNAAVGTIINAESSFFVGDVKYVLNGEQTTSMTLASSGTNTLNINVKEADTYTYTVNAIIDGTSTVLKQLATGSIYADEEVIVPHPTYINYNGTLYQSAATNNEYRKSFAVTSNAQVNTVSYTATDIKVVYFSEAEEISGMTVNTDGTNVAIRASNAAAASIPDGGVTVCSLPAGTYKIYMQTHNTKNNAVVKVSLTCGEQNIDVTTSTGVNRQTGSSDEFTVASTTDLALSSLDGNGLVDWLYVVQTAVSKTITDAGWATYCSPYALDFSGEIANLIDAYIVTGGAKGVLAKTSVKGGKVAANTGLLIEGTEGTITIPVAASGTDYTGTNKLVGVTANTVIDPNAGYVLLNETTGEMRGLGFYKNSKAFTVGANTAYLPIDFDGTKAPAFYGLFDSNVTGISATLVNSEKVNSEIYNLAGQRVAAPTKGLYIVNGKKMVLK